MSKNFDKISNDEMELLKTVLVHIGNQLSSPDLAGAFLNNLLTEKERLTIARRLLIASMIQREVTYMEINEKLSVSPNTFTKIKKWLESELPDYNTVLEHTTKATRERLLSKAKHKKDFGDPLSFNRLKHNYPGHFLLFTLAEEIFNKLK